MTRTIARLAQLAEMVGEEVGASAWMEIAQARVNTFADATDDHQWIHIDPERAARDSPFGGPIAHGFLTLSLLPGMLETAMRIEDVSMVINYGLNKVRFTAPVPVGGRVRARFTLHSAEKIEHGYQLCWNAVIDIENAPKPACVAELVVRCFV
jgi:acyl dehydratase